MPFLSLRTAKPFSTPLAISTAAHGEGLCSLSSCGTHWPLTIFHSAEGSAARPLTGASSSGKQPDPTHQPASSSDPASISHSFAISV